MRGAPLATQGFTATVIMDLTRGQQEPGRALSRRELKETHWGLFALVQAKGGDRPDVGFGSRVIDEGDFKIFTT